MSTPSESGPATATTALPPSGDKPNTPEIRTVATWETVWVDILGGGPGRWKNSAEDCLVAYEILKKAGFPEKGSLFVPLAGDVPMVSLAYSKGHSVMAAEWVPAAVAVMKKTLEQVGATFQPKQTVDKTSTPEGGDEAKRRKVVPEEGEAQKEKTEKADAEGKETKGQDKEENKEAAEEVKPALLFTSEDARARLYQGDIFAVDSEQAGTFDAVYDKDAFGAIRPEQREAYLQLMQKLVKPGGVVLLEVKHRSDSTQDGPPFHFTPDQVAVLWKTVGFEVELSVPSVYPLAKKEWRQQAFVLRKTQA